VPLILLHAIGLDAGSWSAAAIPDGIAMDLPGFGEQPLPAGGLHHPQIADDVVARAPAGPLDVVGVSMGSQVAMQIGLRHPDRTRSLVLANSGPAADPEVMRQRAEAVRTQGMESQIGVTLERWFTPAAVAARHPAVEYARNRLRRDDPAAFESGWLAISEHNLKNRLGELRVPVTVIAGSEDRAGPVEVVRQVHEAVPGSRFMVVEGPHILYMEFPDAFRRAVLEHLEWAKSAQAAT
jgi:pimeloyl-ACP methyl ester carboxylesterase